MRNGKIARLPVEIVEKLNRRMERGEEGVTILAWLNGLPEMQAILREGFDGAPVLKQNLTAWRKGGFRVWQARRQLFAQAAERGEAGVPVNMPKLAENLLATLTGQYTRLLYGWDGRRNESIEARARMLSGFAREFATIQKALCKSGEETVSSVDGGSPRSHRVAPSQGQ